MSDLVAQLRDRRRALGLSQRAVGERMNPAASQGNVSDWEGARHDPTAATLERWAAALGVSFTITEISVDTTPEGE